jgi:predicted N-acetyltransferase YhbS
LRESIRRRRPSQLISAEQVALVAKLDGILAGTCLLVRSELESCHPISPGLAGLYVTVEHRRQGIGRVLVEAN